MKGSIRQRGAGVWELAFDLGRDAAGKRVRRFVTVRGPKREAERRLAQELTAAHQRGRIVPQRTTVGVFLQSWLEDVSAQVRPSTFARYRSAVARHLVPHLGEIQLQRLSPGDVAAMQRTCRAEGLSPQTVKHNHVILKEALGYACALELIPNNPADRVPLPRVTRQEMLTLSKDEARRLLVETREHELGPIIYMALHTGARIGELLALKWSDVDFDRRQLSVRLTVQRLKGRGLQTSPTKTHRSNRAISLSPSMVEWLLAHRERQTRDAEAAAEAYTDRNLILPTAFGELRDPGRVSQQFRELLEELRFPRVRFHDLRHTHATLALVAGAHPKTVSERLGHSSVTLTLDRYSHVAATVQEEAARMISDMLDE